MLYRKQLENMIRMDLEKHGEWPEFSRICGLILDIVIPRLLGPLQSNGRIIKPCLIHGHLWDENTATDMDTGDPFIFDAGSFYGHNEYEIGNWRALRHRLSDQMYMENYRLNFPASEPGKLHYLFIQVRSFCIDHQRLTALPITEEEWDDRNLLYSLRYDLGAAILIPGCNMRQV